MNSTLFFLHSAGPQYGDEGSAKLVRYLEKHLSHLYQVAAPVMPNPDMPEYAIWKDALKEYFKELDEHTVLVGHSLGGSVLLKFLSEEYPLKKIQALYLLAVPYWGLEGWDVDDFMLAENFVEHLPEIRDIVIYQSEDDDIVSIKHAETYAAQLPQAKYRLLEGYGHVFWDGLPEMVEHIRGLPR